MEETTAYSLTVPLKGIPTTFNFKAPAFVHLKAASRNTAAGDRLSAGELLLTNCIIGDASGLDADPLAKLALCNALYDAINASVPEVTANPLPGR